MFITLPRRILSGRRLRRSDLRVVRPACVEGYDDWGDRDGGDWMNQLSAADGR